MKTLPYREDYIENIKDVQRAFCLKADGLFGPVTCSALMAAAEPITAHTDLRDSLPYRALQWSLREADRWSGQSMWDSSEGLKRIVEYFRHTQRSGTLLGPWFAEQMTSDGKRYAFCAAAVGFADHQAAKAGEDIPPARAGALEYRLDARAGTRGRWLEAAELRSQIANNAVVDLPTPGSLAVYSRSRDDGKPGGGHVERVIAAVRDGFRAVGANENHGRWYIDTDLVPFSRRNLLGFVIY